jgi:hypothetical protein
VIINAYDETGQVKWQVILPNSFEYGSGVFAAGEPTGVYIGGSSFGPMPGMKWYGNYDVSFVKFNWTDGTTLYEAQIGGIGSEILSAFDVHPTVPDRVIGAGYIFTGYR